MTEELGKAMNNLSVKEPLSENLDELEIEELMEIDDSFISSTSVFRPSADPSEGKRFRAAHEKDAIKKMSKRHSFAKNRHHFIRETKKKLNGLSKKALLITLIVVAALTAAGTGVVAIGFSKLNAPSIPGTALSMPEKGANSANYIFLKKTRTLTDETYTLTKMSADSLSTVFYFDKPIDMHKFSARLLDYKDLEYAIDLHFVMSTGYTGSVLRFAPLNEDCGGFKLELSNPESGESVHFNYALDTTSPFAPARHLKEAIKHDTESGIAATIYSAAFASTGSHILFGLSSTDENVTFSITDDSFAELRQTAANVSRLSPPAIYSLNGSIFGRLDFSALRSLSGKAELKLGALTRTIRLNETLSAEMLFNNTESDQIHLSIENGRYVIVLERMFYKNDTAVLVGHCKDSSGKRIKTLLDVSVTVNTSSGIIIEDLGFAKAKTEGTDILFDLTDEKTFLKGVEPKDFSITINSASFDTEEIVVPFDLENMLQQPENSFENNIAAYLLQKNYQLVAYDINGNSAQIVVCESGDKIPLGIENRILSAVQNNGTWHIDSDRPANFFKYNNLILAEN